MKTWEHFWWGLVECTNSFIFCCVKSRIWKFLWLFEIEFFFFCEITSRKADRFSLSTLMVKCISYSVWFLLNQNSWNNLFRLTNKTKVGSSQWTMLITNQANKPILIRNTSEITKRVHMSRIYKSFEIVTLQILQKFMWFKSNVLDCHRQSEGLSCFVLKWFDCTDVIDLVWWKCHSQYWIWRGNKFRTYEKEYLRQ